MEDDGPIAVRDFPDKCTKTPRRTSQGSSRTPRTPLVRTRDEEEEDEREDRELSSRFKLPDNFSSLGPRDQFLERRNLYSGLKKYFERVKISGKLPGYRPDLQAMKFLNQHQLSLKFQTLGSIPGSEVGDTFDFRSEILVLGLHRQAQGGIAWVDRNGDKVATSVVCSGGYRDDKDFWETITYTGQGGIDYRGDKRQLMDQTPERGNQALINSYRFKIPVRVIRGHGVTNDKNLLSGQDSWNKIYSYDGLYKVTSYKHEAGMDGHKVYTFELKRLTGQPPLDPNKWKSFLDGGTFGVP